MIDAMRRLHFWLPHDPPAGLEDWNPDLDPHLFAHGLGHSFYELYVRCRGLGLRTSIGPRPPSDASAIVVYAKTIGGYSHQLRFLLQAWAYPIMVIRSDAPCSWHPSFKPTMTVMPNISMVTARNHIWLPHLPQRGQRPRAPHRWGHIRSVTYKGNREHLPQFAVNRDWADALRQRGVTWSLPEDAPEITWHDFSSSDIALCARSTATSCGCKPATKLINAWTAGCIPLVSPIPAYLELVEDGRDAFVVSDQDECLDVVDRLLANPDLIRLVESNIRRRARQFSADRVLRLWVDSLSEFLDTNLSAAERFRRLGSIVTTPPVAASKRLVGSSRRSMVASGSQFHPPASGATR